MTALLTFITSRSTSGARGALEVGGRVAGVRGEALDGRARRAQPPVELEREQQVGELRLPVGAPAEVAAVAVQVVEGDPRPILWAVLDSVTTRASSRPSIESEQQAGERRSGRGGWCRTGARSRRRSRRRGGAITPALLISRSSPSWAPGSARRSRDRGEARRGRAPPAPAWRPARRRATRPARPALVGVAAGHDHACAARARARAP